MLPTKDNPYILECGDNRELAKRIPDNSIAQIITDKPYRIDFMGRKWDSNQDFRPILKECLRVLKPGGFAFFMGDIRQDVYAMDLCELAEVGFEIDFDSIEWVYANGFTKAQNFYKQIDRHFFEVWLKTQEFYYDLLNVCMEGIRECQDLFDQYRGTSDGELLKKERDELISEMQGIKHQLKCRWAKECYHIELKPKLLQNPNRLNRSYVTNSDVFSKDRKNDKRRTPFHTFSEDWGDRDSLNNMLSIDPPITPEAKALEGMYTAELKPCREFIIVARKPLTAETNIAHAIEHRNGGLYLDRARIPADFKQLLKNSAKGYCGNGGSNILGFNTGKAKSCKDSAKPPINAEAQNKILKNFQIAKSRGSSKEDWYDRGEEVMNIDLRGRFPATMLVADQALDGPERSSDESLSDLFSLNRWWNFQIQHLPSKNQKIFPFLYVPKPSKNEKNKGLNVAKTVKDDRKTPIDNAFQRGETERQNTHLTIKPLMLASYLIAIGPTKPGDIIYDPFMGSGWMPIACHLSGRYCIGHELEPESFLIAQKRLAYFQKQKNLLQFAME